MGPISAVMFIVGLIMVFAGRNPNNDEVLGGEENRREFLIRGTALIVFAVIIWIYIAINGEPIQLPNYKEIMSRKTSQ